MTEFDREGLEAERDFLLRSLDDLEDERAAGNVDDGTYETLRDDYTARAAAVIRSLEKGKDLTPTDAPSSSKTMRALTIGGLVVFAIVAAFVLTHAVGQRNAGQTITGNSRVASGTTTDTDPGPALADAVKAQPTSYAAHIAYARYLLGQQDFTDAIHEFGSAAQLDPSEAEPPTYAAWSSVLLTRQVKSRASRDTLLSAALERLDEVISDHPKYPDAYALKGVTLLNFENKPKPAIPEFQQFLVLTDDSNPIRAQVLEALANAEKAVQSG